MKFQGKRDLVGLEEFIAENIARVSQDKTVCTDWFKRINKNQ